MILIVFVKNVHPSLLTHASGLLSWPLWCAIERLLEWSEVENRFSGSWQNQILNDRFLIYKPKRKKVKFRVHLFIVIP